MSAPTQAVGGQKDLARRLRELRLRRWPGRTVSQQVLAKALGRDRGRPLSSSLISAWENETSPTMPPERRLRDYATFFATERSLADGGTLVTEAELNATEIAERDKLFAELLSLRDQASEVPAVEDSAPEAIRFDWTFPPGASVRIVCGTLEKPAHPYATPGNPNFTELLVYADGDALMELYGHLWRVNPTDRDIRYLRSDRLETFAAADELNSHLILLGGIGLNELTERILRDSGLPIAQKEVPEVTEDGEIFEVTDGDRTVQFKPKMSDGAVTEDVGLLARMPNPNNSSTTLTICNGVFSRGVLGVVRTLTDDNLRRQNEAYLASRFSGAARFAILMRVKVLFGGRTVLTPDLQNEHTRLYEWSDEPAP